MKESEPLKLFFDKIPRWIVKGGILKDKDFGVAEAKLLLWLAAKRRWDSGLTKIMTISTLAEELNAGRHQTAKAVGFFLSRGISRQIPCTDHGPHSFMLSINFISPNDSKTSRASKSRHLSGGGLTANDNGTDRVLTVRASVRRSGPDDDLARKRPSIGPNQANSWPESGQCQEAE